MINMTPHALNVQAADGSFIEIPTSGVTARIAVGNIFSNMSEEGVVIYNQEVTDPAFLTDEAGLDNDFIPTAGETYIVSGMARIPLQEAFPQATWLSPGNLLRNEDGQPIGCEGLVE